MSLLDRLKKNSTIKESVILTHSKYLNEKDMIPTPVPMLNVALSGSLKGGFTPGVTVWAGPSRHFKTAFSLLTAKSYMDKYPDAVLMFYDNEFGSPKKYFEAFNIDMDRVLHIPFTNIEELKFDVMNQLAHLERGDKAFFMIDSIGNVASKKEIDDALDQKSSADMTRSKQIKSFFRMVTPHLTMKDLVLSVIAHTYKTMEMFSKDVVSGGCVVAGTKITMADNSCKCIENIQVGDQVKTIEGPETITHVWKPHTLINGNPLCYEIVFEDDSKCIVSENHMFLCPVDGWVRADELCIGEEVICKFD